MGFRFIPSFVASLNRDDDGGFVQGYWDEGVADLYNGFLIDSSYNAGQQTILQDSEEDIQRYLSDIGENYDPDEFLSFLQSFLGDAKYAALSETWTDFSEQLIDLCDHATGGDGFGKKKFMGVEYD